MLTPRIKLIETSERDVPALATLFSDPDVSREAIGSGADRSERSHLYISRSLADRTIRSWSLVEQSSNELIGCLSLNSADAQLSYWLGRAHWGEGFATEAVGLLLASGIADLRTTEVYAITARDNWRSRRVLDRCGFIFRGLTHRRTPDRPEGTAELLYARMLP